MPTPLPTTTALAAEPSLFFCSTAGCPFHVTVGDPNVQGFGDWATLANGITVSHRWVDARLLCDLCARHAVVRIQLSSDTFANAADRDNQWLSQTASR